MISAEDSIGMKKNFIGSLLLISLLAVGCAPADRGSARKELATTYSTPNPVVSKEGKYTVVNGATEVKNIVAVYDSVKNELALTGQIHVKPVSGANPFDVDLDMFGYVNSEGLIYMGTKKTLPAGVQVGATVYCLGEGQSCHKYFVDFYVNFEDKNYRHQVGSEENPEIIAMTPSTLQSPDPNGDENEKLKNPNIITDVKRDDVGSNDKASKEGGKKNEPSKVNTPSKPEEKKTVKPTEPVKAVGKAAPAKPEIKKADDDEEEDDEGNLDPEYRGRYLGDAQRDIEKLFYSQKGVPAKGRSKNVYDQVIGEPARGRLENGSSLYTFQQRFFSKGFHVIRPERERYYGSVELLAVIKGMGEYTRSIIPDYNLAVGDLSQKSGGKVGKHASHQNGLDVDIAYYSKNAADKDKLISMLSRSTTGSPVSSWMESQQWKLFKYAVGTKYVDRIFIHPNLKSAICQEAIRNGEIKSGQKDGVIYETLRRLRPEKNHYNHFHMRVKCSSNQARCRQMADPPEGTGCF